MKNILIFCILILFGGHLLAQCPGPAQRNALINLQRSLEVEGTRAGQIPLTDTCGNQRYAQYVEVNPDTINYIPTDSGNTQNLSEFVRDTTGTLWYIDWQGNAVSFQGGGGSCDADFLEISDNSCPDALTDSIYKYRYVAVGARYVWPGAEMLVNDSTSSGIVVIQGSRNARLALYDSNAGTFSMIDHGGTTPVWYLPVGANLLWRTTAGTPQTPVGSQVSHFAINTQDSTIQAFQYPNTRTDTQTVVNFLYTDGVGKFRSRPISYIVDSAGLQPQLTFNRGLSENAANTVSLGDSIVNSAFNSLQNPIINAGRIVAGSTPLEAAGMVWGDWNETGIGMYTVQTEDTSGIARFIGNNGYDDAGNWGSTAWGASNTRITQSQAGQSSNAISTVADFTPGSLLVTSRIGSGTANTSTLTVTNNQVQNRSFGWNNSSGVMTAADNTSGYTGGFGGYLDGASTSGNYYGIGRARLTAPGINLPGNGNGQDSTVNFVVQRSTASGVYNWLAVTDMVSDTTADAVNLYNNSYSFVNDRPSTTLGDTTIHAWAGTGTAATPVFMPLPAGDGDGIYGGSGYVPQYTYARFADTASYGGDAPYFMLGRGNINGPFDATTPISLMVLDDQNGPCFWCGTTIITSDTTQKTLSEFSLYSTGILLDSRKFFGANSRSASFSFNVNSPNSIISLNTGGVGEPIVSPLSIDTAGNITFGPLTKFEYQDNRLGIGDNFPETNLDVAGTSKTQHLAGQDLTPTISVNTAGAGTGASASMTNAQSSDLAGRFSITSGTGATTGLWATITFDDAFSVTPIVQVYNEDADAAALNHYVNVSTTSFEFFVAGGQADATTYDFNFIIIGGK